MKLVNEFKKNLIAAKAEQQGIGVSQKRRIKPFAARVDLPTLEAAKMTTRNHGPQPTGVTFADARGRRFEYFTDGSARAIK